MRRPNVFIQWKNTTVCLDFYCVCGEQGHFDGDFCFSVECWKCHAKFTLPHILALENWDERIELTKLVEP